MVFNETTESKEVHGLDCSSMLLLHEVRYRPDSALYRDSGSPARISDGGSDTLHCVSDGPSMRLG
jgi:hypothetical protein